jgi:regulator of sigma E protease
MSVILVIIQFVIILGLLLFFHEFGHFIVARLFKIEVEEFGFGLPPRIVRLFTWKGTEFTINWIPFGAFVKPKGENDPDVPGGLSSANPWVRLAVLLAGPAMNLLVGIIVLVIFSLSVGKENLSIVRIATVSPSSPASQAGLLPGDIVVEANQEKIDGADKLVSITKSNLGNEISLTYLRKNQKTTVRVIPRQNPPSGQGPLGVGLGSGYDPITFGEAWGVAVNAAVEQGKQLILLPYHLIKGTITPEQAQLRGPIGMLQIFGEISRLDAQAAPASTGGSPPMGRLNFVALISIALGLTNLMPIPALDGGRILFVLPELVLRKRVPARYENTVHMVGLAALLILMVLITVNDVIHPFTLP